MRKLVLVFAAVFVLGITACNDDYDSVSEEGMVVFDLSGLDLESNGLEKSASTEDEIIIQTTINGEDYILEEGEQLILQVFGYTITKFNIFVNDIHKYMLGENIDFDILANETVAVQVPVFRVDNPGNEYGKGEFEVIESAYHAIKNGRPTYALYYSTEDANRLLYAANIQGSAEDGFPVLRLYNGYSDKVVEYTYGKYNSSEKYTFLVGPNTQMYVLLPGAQNADGTWIVESGSFKKTITIN